MAGNVEPDAVIYRAKTTSRRRWILVFAARFFLFPLTINHHPSGSIRRIIDYFLASAYSPTLANMPKNYN